MLADEVSAQNESLEDYGLNNAFDGQLLQGWYDENRVLKYANDNLTTKNMIKISTTDTITIKLNKVASRIYAIYRNNGVYVSEEYITSSNKATFIAPNSVNEMDVTLVFGSATTPSEIDLTVFINNEIEALKNDLDKLNSLPIGSIIQIEAAKDNIETTTQKYGWQYLGTSNIEYNDGSERLLVTHVYRKNN